MADSESILENRLSFHLCFFLVHRCFFLYRFQNWLRPLQWVTPHQMIPCYHSHGISYSYLCLSDSSPGAPKHLWNLIASWFSLRERWIRPEKMQYLPNTWYSYQVLFFLLIVPLTIYVNYQWRFGGIPPYPKTWEEYASLFGAFYAGQLIALYHMRKLPLGYSYYFYGEPNPKVLISWRMLITGPFTIVIPIMFGALYYSAILWLGHQSDLCCKILGVFWILSGAFFPYLCDQSVLLIAMKRKWFTPETSPEAYEAPKAQSWVCLVLTILVISTTFAVLLSSDFFDFVMQQVSRNSSRARQLDRSYRAIGRVKCSRLPRSPA